MLSRSFTSELVTVSVSVFFIGLRFIQLRVRAVIYVCLHFRPTLSFWINQQYLLIIATAYHLNHLKQS